MFSPTYFMATASDTQVKLGQPQLLDLSPCLGMWFVGKSSHLLNGDWSIRKSSCQSVVTIGELLSECQHDRLTSKAADQVSHGFEWLLFDGHIALFCVSEGTSKISSVDILTKVPWIHYGGLTTSHTRLAQMVADTIFDRRELGLVPL